MKINLRKLIKEEITKAQSELLLEGFWSNLKDLFTSKYKMWFHKYENNIKDVIELKKLDTHIKTLTLKEKYLILDWAHKVLSKAELEGTKAEISIGIPAILAIGLGKANLMQNFQLVKDHPAVYTTMTICVAIAVILLLYVVAHDYVNQKLWQQFMGIREKLYDLGYIKKDALLDEPTNAYAIKKSQS